MLTVLLITAAPIQPFDLETLSLHQARALDGQRVQVTFIIGKPPYRWEASTIIGTDDTPDAIERTAILKGRRLDVKEGRRITVTGTLKVIDHPARMVGREIIPPWTEIRLEETR